MRPLPFIAAISLLVICGCSKTGQPDHSEDFDSDYVVVTHHGINNNGSQIGSELNELVKANYGRTLYFPAGVYNLSEPIVLPFDYSKNVNLILDHNAVVTTYKPLEALLKIGFSEMKNTSSMRLFSFVEGGTFNAENAENGIWVNGLKQLVSLRTMNIIKCHGAHVRISVINDLTGTGSSDTKLDNVTIQGYSSNENNYGIYIDRFCCDCKISDCFIYGTDCGIYTASAGHVINNVHILSWVASGGKDLGTSNFKGTEGIRVESGGFFTFNEIYFDTTDKDLVIGNVSPSIILDKPMSYSWFKGVGTSFVYRSSSYSSPFQLKISGGNIDIGNKASPFRIFDIERGIIPSDNEGRITFTNTNLIKGSTLYPLDYSLMMRLRGTRSEKLLNGPAVFSPGWNSLGALAPGSSENHLEVRLSEDIRVRLRIRFTLEGQVNASVEGDAPAGFSFGYIVIDRCCILLFSPEAESTLHPEVIDLDGNSSYLCTPDKDRVFTLGDYTNSTLVTMI